METNKNNSVHEVFGIALKQSEIEFLDDMTEGKAKLILSFFDMLHHHNIEKALYLNRMKQEQAEKQKSSGSGNTEFNDLMNKMRQKKKKPIGEPWDEQNKTIYNNTEDTLVIEM
jgi:hypothetical protein